VIAEVGGDNAAERTEEALTARKIGKDLGIPLSNRSFTSLLRGGGMLVTGAVRVLYRL
jgi:hypothetical protein